MKIVTNGKKYRLWDKYEGFLLISLDCPYPWQGDTKREAEIRLDLLKGGHTWTEVTE